MLKLSSKILKILLVFAIAFTALAQNSAIDKKLIVGTKIAPPFAMKTQSGQWEGISIELWQKIAKELNIDYEFREYDLQGLLASVGSSQIDLAIAAITINAQREEILDFSHSYYPTGLSIAVVKGDNKGLLNILKGLFSRQMLTIILGLASIFLLVGSLVWLFERRKNPEHFSPKPVSGIGDGIWWAAVTMTTVGYGDMAPKTLAGRILAMLWMFSSLLLLSIVIAGISSALTVANVEPLVSGESDLVNVRVASIKNSSSDLYLQENQVRSIRYYPSVKNALEGLEQKDVDAVVYDDALLKYLINKEFNSLEVLPGLFELQGYGIAMPTNSPLREKINRVILQIIREDDWKDILTKYLGD
ncbi:MAG TPA: transporter substrate-binding domain-containing protein [Trueperaceae bacterium]|nr:transporter substrate-binding domain-containing protein [Trueperaceae bacterium]